MSRATQDGESAIGDVQMPWRCLMSVTVGLRPCLLANERSHSLSCRRMAASCSCTLGSELVRCDTELIMRWCPATSVPQTRERHSKGSQAASERRFGGNDLPPSFASLPRRPSIHPSIHPAIHPSSLPASQPRTHTTTSARTRITLHHEISLTFTSNQCLKYQSSNLFLLATEQPVRVVLVVFDLITKSNTTRTNRGTHNQSIEHTHTHTHTHRQGIQFDSIH